MLSWIYTAALFNVITPYATVSSLQATRILDVFLVEKWHLALTTVSAEQNNSVCSKDDQFLYVIKQIKTVQKRMLKNHNF